MTRTNLHGIVTKPKIVLPNASTEQHSASNERTAYKQSTVSTKPIHSRPTEYLWQQNATSKQKCFINTIQSVKSGCHTSIANSADLNNPLYQTSRIDVQRRSIATSRSTIFAQSAFQAADIVNNGQGVNRITKGPNSRSDASTVSRRTALALQRLEEDRQMRENREEEYLTKKYSLLEDDMYDDISQSDDLEQVKRDRIEKWSQGLPDPPIGIALAQMQLSDSTSTAINGKDKPEIGFPSQPNQIVSVTQASSHKSDRRSQRSIATIKKARTIETIGPHPWKKHLKEFQDTLEAAKAFSKIASTKVPDTQQFVMKLPPPRSLMTSTSTNVRTSVNQLSSNVLPSQGFPILSQNAISNSMVNPIVQSTAPHNYANSAFGSNITNVASPLFKFTKTDQRPQTVQSINSVLPASSTSILPSTFASQPINVGSQTTPSNNVIRSTYGYTSAVASNGLLLSQPQPTQSPRSRKSNVLGQGFLNTHPNRGTTVASNVQNLFSNVPPQFTSNSSSYIGSTSFGYQHQIPIFSSQNGVTNSTPIGSPKANVISMQSLRLTAEMIAARHVIPKLPKFDGNPRRWYAFKGAFEFSTAACGFTNVENLGRIQDSLVDEAKDSVGCRLIHLDAVVGVMSTLKLLFGRSDLIIECLINDIKREPPPSDDDIPSLIQFAILVQNLCASIQETGKVEHLRNPTLMNAIVDKLPVNIRLNWAYHRRSMNVVDLATLSNWLHELVDVASQVVRRSIHKSYVITTQEDRSECESISSTTPSSDNEDSTSRDDSSATLSSSQSDISNAQQSEDGDSTEAHNESDEDSAVSSNGSLSGSLESLSGSHRVSAESLIESSDEDSSNNQFSTADSEQTESLIEEPGGYGSSCQTDSESSSSFSGDEEAAIEEVKRPESINGGEPVGQH